MQSKIKYSLVDTHNSTILYSGNAKSCVNHWLQEWLKTGDEGRYIIMPTEYVGDLSEEAEKDIWINAFMSWLDCERKKG